MQCNHHATAQGRAWLQAELVNGLQNQVTLVGGGLHQSRCSGHTDHAQFDLRRLSQHKAFGCCLGGFDAAGLDIARPHAA